MPIFAQNKSSQLNAVAIQKPTQSNVWNDLYWNGAPGRTDFMWRRRVNFYLGLVHQSFSYEIWRFPLSRMQFQNRKPFYFNQISMIHHWNTQFSSINTFNEQIIILVKAFALDTQANVFPFHSQTKERSRITDIRTHFAHTMNWRQQRQQPAFCLVCFVQIACSVCCENNTITGYDERTRIQ